MPRGAGQCRVHGLVPPVVPADDLQPPRPVVAVGRGGDGADGGGGERLVVVFALPADRQRRPVRVQQPFRPQVPSPPGVPGQRLRPFRRPGRGAGRGLGGCRLSRGWLEGGVVELQESQAVAGDDGGRGVRAAGDMADFPQASERALCDLACASALARPSGVASQVTDSRGWPASGPRSTRPGRRERLRRGAAGLPALYIRAVCARLRGRSRHRGRMPVPAGTGGPAGFRGRRCSSRRGPGRGRRPSGSPSWGSAVRLRRSGRVRAGGLRSQTLPSPAARCGLLPPGRCRGLLPARRFRGARGPRGGPRCRCGPSPVRGRWRPGPAGWRWPGRRPDPRCSRSGRCACGWPR